MLARESKGFTLIELLIVVAIIGIIAAIAVPNLLNAIDRAKQKRTMADMRSIGVTIEAYAVDANVYPGASDINALRSVLEEGNYIKKLPTTDGWNNTLIYEVNQDGSGYTLRSTGKGGQVQASPPGGTTTSISDDIIYVSGQFMQWPDGIQK